MKPKQFGLKAIQKITAKVKATLEEGECRAIASKYNLRGYNRIYLLHIRKTGGTSLNNMFLSLSGEDSRFLYSQLAKKSDHRLISNGLVYVGWNVEYINKGNYFYAFSHTPLHRLDIPKETFTVSCFRDPIKRVLSHYNMLMDFRVNNINHPCMAIEGKWLGESFDEFLHQIPREHLLNQLYMFSSSFNVNEGVENVQQLSHYFFSDAFDNGINELNRKTGLNLEPIHIRKTDYHAQISVGDLTRLRDLLDKEYMFLERIR